ncbi:hypothetical protein ACFP1Z_18475 [Streptomyces gamaensis]|uniref:Lipoprotein n=1 Tax=Streptomyces gamaensis TaxID=1763542 RepID=A0ABW0Z332_9ACTN
MRIRHTLLLCTATAALLGGCSGGAAEPGDDAGREWNPKTALRRAERALDAAAGEGAGPESVDSGTAFIASGLEQEFAAPGDRPYRLDITCDAVGIEEAALTLSRGGKEQTYDVGCGDRQADRFDIPAGRPFTARVEAVKDGTGLILWRLGTVSPGEVSGFP